MPRLRLLLLLSLMPAALFADVPIIGWDVRPADARRGIAAAERNLPFEAAALSWRADREIALRIRVPGDEWVVPPLDDDLTFPDEGRWFTAIVHFGSAQRALEYAFDAPDGVRDLTITFFVPPEPERAARDVAPDAISALGIRSRTDWGCPDGQVSRGVPSYTKVTHVIVHHTAGSNDLTDWEAEVRNIWYLHTITNGWIDVGYNWLIDPNGVIYEGRAGGDGALGAHFSCRNTNTAGVAILGTYTSGLPSEGALASLTRLVGELTGRWDLDPDAWALHAPSQLNLQTISGHRDGNAGYPTNTCTWTECPGEAFYSYLPILRTAVASCERPAIADPPAPRAMQPGESATLSAIVSGSGPLAYQWYAGAPGDTSTPIAGATGETLAVPSVPGAYWVRVTNGCGAETSGAFVVTLGVRSRGRLVGR